MIIKKLIVLLLIALIVGCTANGNTRQARQPESKSTKAAVINTKLGLNYMQRGEYKVAMDKLLRALEQDSTLPSAHNTIAVLYQRLGENDNAEQHFKEAVQRAPDYAEARNNYGVFLCQQERYLEAEQRFLEAIDNSLYENKAQAYENAGICVGLIPDATLAEQYFRKALKLNPNLAKSLYQMANLSYLNIDYEQAKSYINRYQNVSQWTAQALFLAMKIENKFGNQDAVASYGLLLRARFPDSDEALQVKKGLY